MDDKTERIRQLNDDFRATFDGGSLFVTRGILALPEDVQTAIEKLVKQYDDFTEENDPHAEHDYGSFRIAGHHVCFKIDYYDARCKWGSEDPADIRKTTRVLTIMLSSER